MTQALAASHVYPIRNPNRTKRDFVPHWVDLGADSIRQPGYGNGEKCVAEILDKLGLTWLYEQRKYRVRHGWINPDFRLPQVHGRELIIEVTDSIHELGCNKQGRLGDLERFYRLPVWFINTRTLHRLRMPDGLEVAAYCLARHAFKPPAQYGNVWTPSDVLEPVRMAA